MIPVSATKLPPSPNAAAKRCSVKRCAAMKSSSSATRHSTSPARVPSERRCLPSALACIVRRICCRFNPIGPSIIWRNSARRKSAAEPPSGVSAERRQQTPLALHVTPVTFGAPELMSAATSYLKNLDYSVVQQCMHCGMCLPTCPTYDATKLERNSPRGRIALMRAIADNRLEPTQAFADEMYFCLGCLACMTACPAGVNYAELFEHARAEAEQSGAL